MIKCKPDCTLCTSPDPVPKFKCNKCMHIQDSPNECRACSAIWIAHNKCNKCNYEWHGPPGPSTSNCPSPARCDSLYWTWMNYPINKPNWCEICKAEFI